VHEGPRLPELKNGSSRHALWPAARRAILFGIIARPKESIMSEAPGPHLGDAREDIIGAYERYQEELPQKVIDAALHVAAETDTKASEIKLLIAMWNAADAYINWCHEQGFPPADGTYESAKGIAERLLFIESMQGEG
jgi:hypothetical protein